MKKNNMMRIASVLLVAVLLTSCVIAGTFAKYVSSTSGTDNARVAYWGWGEAGQTLGATMDIDLFDDVYGTTVDSEDGDNVVAPGTENEINFAFAYTNNVNDAIEAPEVDYTFEVVATATGSYDALDDNENFKWTLDGDEYDTVAELLAAINALDGNRAAVEDDPGTDDINEAKAANYYEANTLPTGFGVGSSHTIGWFWTYTVDEAGDIADTAMGNADPLDNVTINIAITATQVD